MKEHFKVKKLHPDAVIPTYKHEGDAGMDIRSIESLVIEPGERKLVKSGLAFVIPIGYEIQVRPRSGLALKHGITVLNAPGTVDSAYRGDVGAILINHSDKPFMIEKGMRIAQIVFAKVKNVHNLVEVHEIDETVRNTNGFGSTGLK